MVSKTVNNKPRSVFADQEVIDQLNNLYDKFVLVPADKAANNVVLICRTYYYQCLVKELGIGERKNKSTYERTMFSKEDILNNHKSVIKSFNITLNDKNLDLPYMYWIPKLHKFPYKQCYTAGSIICSTKPLSRCLTLILTAIKDGVIEV